MDSISRSSSNTDFNIVPVARSYANYDWERAAGPYAQDLAISSCSTIVCTLDIPLLSSLDESGKFLLMSFTHSLSSDQERVSRFFQQTTFGPTRDLINAWSYGAGSLDSEMTSWLSKQMNEDETAMTSHRAYFRKNLDRSVHYQGGAVDNSLPFNDFHRSRHPCEQYSRWREYSFTADDYGYPLTAVHYSGGYLLSVNNIPRTIVSTHEWKTNYGHNIGSGTFSFCKWSQKQYIYINFFFNARNDSCKVS